MGKALKNFSFYKTSVKSKEKQRRIHFPISHVLHFLLLLIIRVWLYEELWVLPILLFGDFQVVHFS